MVAGHGAARHRCDHRRRRHHLGPMIEPSLTSSSGGEPSIASPPTDGAAVVLAGLRFAYPDGHVALDDLDLSVAPGERLAVLGPNGSGKTTLTLHLNGILTPAAGTVTIADLPVAKPHLREIRRRVGIVFQDPDDQLFMPTVRQDVAFGPANLGHRGHELDARVNGALEAVGMIEAIDRAPNHLSLGQRRRVALATVLAMEPTVLVFDEPSANLDPVARRELATIVRTLQLTTIIVTHDLLYAAELCERAVILDGGRLVADGPTLDLLADAELLAAHRLELPIVTPQLRLRTYPTG
jgi:cobalt/nickel transport system ATP-binding protein